MLKNSGQFFADEGVLDANLMRFLPQFDYLLTDLNIYQDAEIKQIFQLISLQTGLVRSRSTLETGLVFTYGRLGIVGVHSKKIILDQTTYLFLLLK